MGKDGGGGDYGWTIDDVEQYDKDQRKRRQREKISQNNYVPFEKGDKKELIRYLLLPITLPFMIIMLYLFSKTRNKE